MKTTADDSILLCEICGKLATNGVNDSIEVRNHETRWITHRKAGTHYFCEEHERLPLVVDIETIFE